MTPFLQLRIWFRKASAAQRASTIVGVSLLAALVLWSAIPSSSGRSTLLGVGEPGSTAALGVAGTGGTRGSTTAGGSSATQQAATGSEAGASFTTSSGGTAGSSSGSPIVGASPAGDGGAAIQTGSGSGSGSGASGTTGATSPSGSSGTSGTSGGTQTCASTGKLRIGVIVPEGAGGTINAVIGAPPTSQEEADYAAVFDSINKAGGVDCNDLVADYATSDLTNPSSAQAGCLQFQQDKVFAVLGGFEPLFSDDCLLQAHIPTFDQLSIPSGAARQFYPYYFSPDPTYEVLYKNFVGAMSQMGYFGAAHHFAKLGIFYEDCTPELHTALLSDLATAGVSGSKVDTFDLGCSSAFSSPSSIEAAVLKFKSDGVTTAMFADDLADGANISNIANIQGWKPTWIVADDGPVAVENSAQGHPNASEFDGAVAVTSGQYGAIGAHLPETAATQACDKIMTSHGLPTVYASGDQFAGSTCSLIWMLVGALQHGSVSASGIVAGLQAAKSITLSFPNGPNDFSALGTTTGGEYWRIDTYHASCQCWVTDNPTWNASFS